MSFWNNQAGGANKAPPSTGDAQAGGGSGGMNRLKAGWSDFASMSKDALQKAKQQTAAASKEAKRLAEITKEKTKESLGEMFKKEPVDTRFPRPPNHNPTAGAGSLHLPLGGSVEPVVKPRGSSAAGSVDLMDDLFSEAMHRPPGKSVSGQPPVGRPASGSLMDSTPPSAVQPQPPSASAGVDLLGDITMGSGGGVASSAARTGSLLEDDLLGAKATAGGGMKKSGSLLEDDLFSGSGAGGESSVISTGPQEMKKASSLLDDDLLGGGDGAAPATGGEVKKSSSLLEDDLFSGNAAANASDLGALGAQGGDMKKSGSLLEDDLFSGSGAAAQPALEGVDIAQVRLDIPAPATGAESQVPLDIGSLQVSASGGSAGAEAVTVSSVPLMGTGGGEAVADDMFGGGGAKAPSELDNIFGSTTSTKPAAATAGGDDIMQLLSEPSVCDYVSESSLKIAAGFNQAAEDHEQE